MSDERDQPEEVDWGPVMPFVVCASKGGPYDDDAFVAGYQAGQLDKALAAARAVGATEVRGLALSALVPQLELIGMHHGFPYTTADAPEDYPTWVYVTFAAERPEPADA